MRNIARVLVYASTTAFLLLGVAQAFTVTLASPASSLIQIASADAPTIFSAILPNARTTTVGRPVTAFAMIINAGQTSTATACSPTLPSGIPATLHFQATNS